ncbi:TetR/AcrR family transcriptional regulator [Sphingomonas fennica]|uniref:TetR/AcrR family transcriptional regulator n=1 Tax=Edaphosphingomonas fennica TaxID=114404 RepID=A0A2T4HLW6_9SPHN|nr:TetR/AcrR family transcriptional regulator [Sphingomonas fennica]PTD16804.1 TetR/AcrR family transcriptional regulator [Sphingomonas fennica]
MLGSGVEGDKRSHILKTAGMLFLERGFGRTSMGEVAAAGAGSKGTIYSYFRSKEELFKAFMFEAIQARVSGAFEVLSEAGGIRTALNELGRRYLRLITDPVVSAIYRVVIHEAPHFPEIGDMFNDAGPKPAKRHLANYFAQGIEQGKLEIGDVPMAVEQFLMLCQARIVQDFWFCIRGAPTEDEIDKAVNAAVFTFLAAYATDQCD